MLKTITALAVLSAFATTASAQSSVTIYGILDAGVTYLDNNGPAGSRTSVEAGQLQTSRWGFRGVEDLGNGLQARFGLEGTLANDTGAAGSSFGTPANSNLFDRQATVGLASKTWGSIDAGRQNLLAIGVVGLADPLGISFAGTNPNVLFTAMNHGAVFGTYGANGGGTALRQNNSVKYVTPSFSGFNLSAMRAFGEQSGNIQAGSYTGVSASYNNGPFGAAASAQRMKNTADTDTLDSFAVGLKYTNPRFVVKGTYSESELDVSNRKISVLGVGADVPVAPAFVVTGAVYNTKRSGDARDDSQQYHLIGKYSLSKRSTAYAAYTRANTDSVVTASQINLAQGIVAVGSDAANRFTVGVMHQF